MSRSQGRSSVSDRRVGVGGDDQHHRAPSPWIVSSWVDLILFSATPLLIIPLVAMARTRFSLEDIAVFVVAFGAIGHNLPGMMRVYGDLALFQRYRVRFILAPLFLLTTCFLFAHRNLNGLGVILLVWGFWHGLMQVYGFVRIYDAKYKSFASLTARLDYLTCLTWFVAAFLHSPGRMNVLLAEFYSCGGPFLPPIAFHWFQTSWDVLTAVVSVAFVANYVWQLRSGHPANPMKLFTIAMSVGFWWYTMVFINNTILGIALFEIFHDVQYLAIVWVYNRKRVEKDPDVGAFTRFVFQPRAIMMFVYVGIVFAYGYLAYEINSLDKEDVMRSLFGVLVASSFLHFYYDGFIWKISEKSTSESLGLTGGGTRRDTAWLVHGLKWGVFVLPACILGFAQQRGTVPRVAAWENIVEILPDSELAHERLGVILQSEGRYAEAIRQFREAIRIRPDFADAHHNLAAPLKSQGKIDEAIRQYREALRIKPDFAEAHHNLAFELRSRGKSDEAISHFRKALKIKPGYVEAHNNLGLALASRGDIDQAMSHYREVLKIRPGDVESHNNLGVALASWGKLDQAISHYREALKADPGFVETHSNLGVALASRGKLDEAVSHFREAVELEPDSADLHKNLGIALESQGEVDEAIGHYRQVLQIRPNHAEVRRLLARALEQGTPRPSAGRTGK